MTDHVVNIGNLTRRFGKTVALDNVDLQIRSGCVFGLVGENGAGKTTLLKHILGLYRPQQGRVRVFGDDPVEKTVDVLKKLRARSTQCGACRISAYDIALRNR